jgi:Leucine-rich repeat (LRR) protein
MKAVGLLAMIPILACGADWFEQQGARLERDARTLDVVAVDLTGVWVSDADLERLAEFPKLQRLVLAHTRVTDAGFAYLAALKGVRELDCYYAEFFTADALAQLAGWQSLERLVLRGTRVTSKAFEHIARLKSLRSLDVGYSQIDDAGLDLLAELPVLDTLALGGNRVSAAGLAQLRMLKSLRHLDLGGVQRVDSGEWGILLNPATLGEVGGLTGLRSLNLAGATLADVGADRPGLKESVRKTIEGLDRLTKLANLESLDLSRLPLSAAALAPLAALPRLRELRASLAPALGEPAVAVLLRFPALSRVRLDGSIPAPAMARLTAQRPQWFATQGAQTHE